MRAVEKFEYQRGISWYLCDVVVASHYPCHPLIKPGPFASRSHDRVINKLNRASRSLSSRWEGNPLSKKSLKMGVPLHHVQKFKRSRRQSPSKHRREERRPLEDFIETGIHLSQDAALTPT